MNKTHTHFFQRRHLLLVIVALFSFHPLIFASHADLELTMSSPNSNPGIFANVDITITLTNNGPEATENVLLEFPFPTDLPITGDPVESQGFFSNWWTGTGTWTVGTLAPGQTETVTLTLFTLAEDLFFYGQVVNSSIVDNDSSPDNGTPPTPNEDDEAVVFINDTGGGNCQLTALVSNIHCDDNGTPNLENDDLVVFDLTVNGQNTSGTWEVDLPIPFGSPIHISEPIGTTRTFSYFIADVNSQYGGIINFDVYDSIDGTCTDNVQVAAPLPCSFGTGCAISASVFNTQCFDNGTPDDPNDDTWSFDLNVIGENASASWMATINGQTYSGNYNDFTPLGLFNISDGPMLAIDIFDTSDPSCSASLFAAAPPPCSDNTNQCSITATIVSVDCNNQGNTNPNDDTWDYTVQVDGTGVDDGQWVTSVPFGLPGAGGFFFGDYGETFSISNVPSFYLSRQHLIRHVPDLECQTTIVIDAPSFPCPTGSNCSIDATVLSVDCNTMGNNNPNDDVWSYIIDIDGTNTSNTWMAPFTNGFYSGTYDQNLIIENLPLTGFENIIQLINDSADPNCNITVSIDAPFPCNNADKPDLELTMTSNDQSGAFQNISFDITVTNSGTAPANGVSISTELPNNVVLQGGNECDATGGNANCFVSNVSWFFTSIAPGQTETLTVNFFTLNADPITFYAEVSDINGEDEDSTPGNGTPPIVNEDDEAAFTVGGGVPCTINTSFYNNIECFDNGTAIESDDYFNFEFTVTGTGTAFNFTSNGGVNGTFNYGETIVITGFAYADLPFSMTGTDVNDPLCFFSRSSFGAFQPCSSGTECSINFDDVTYVCDDNGTTDSNDDTYTIELTASGQGADAGTGWTSDFNGQYASANYGQVGVLGPFLINDGNLQIPIQDNTNPDCNRLLYAFPPPPCSSGGGGDTDLKLEVSPSTIFAGSNAVTYTITITNEGTNDASGVSMQFYQGNSFGIVNSNASTGSYNLQSKIWSVGNIAAGTSETLTLDDQYVDFGAGSLPTYPFFEILTMDNNDPDSTPGNDNGDRTADEDDEAILAIFPLGGGYPADLSVNLQTPSTTINLGETFVITFEVDLDNGAATGDVLAELILPPSLQYQSHNASQGTFNANTGDWDVGYIGGLSDAELVVTVTLIDDSQSSVIYGQLTDGGSFDFDSTPGNGTCCTPNEDDEAALTIQPNGTVLKPDLELTNTTVNHQPNSQFITANVSILNSGTALSPDNLSRIYFSNDNQLSSDDEIVYSFSMSNALAAGDIFSYNSPFTISIPANTPNGNYFLIIKLDDEEAVDELNENNNITTYPITIGDMGGGTDLELSISSSSNFQQWGYVSFDITVTNTGTESATGVSVLLSDIDGGVLEGGNEGNTTAGTFYPVGGAPSTWDLSNETIAAGTSETLTINCFVLDPATIQVYAEVIAMNEDDVDSSPYNGTPFAPNEDDEALGFVGAAPSPMQSVFINENDVQGEDYALFKIQNLYPNPVSNHLKIAVASATEQAATLQIANTQGSEVIYLKKELVQGQNMLTLDAADLPKGIYFLKIETENGMEIQRFLKN